MSAQRFFVPAGAGIAAIGGYVLYNSQKPEKSPEQQRRAKSQAKKDAGLSGAGVGQNAVTGMHEGKGPGSGVPTDNKDPSRTVKTDAPRDELPSGGVGGGVGGGGANTRKTVDISAKETPGQGSGSGQGSAASSSGNQGSGQGKSSWSQGLQGIFSQGGSTASQKDQAETKIHDTKVHSNHGDTPTKRFPGETVK